MKKVGIITINDNANIGNRLQNYAVQELLYEMGMEAFTIYNYNKYFKNKIIILNSKKRLIRMYRMVFKRKIYIREKNFRKFNKKYIKFSKYIISTKYIPKKLEHEYDYFVTGSDQVWNYKFGRASNVDFLNFADSKKRISLSASFGISNIPDKLKDYYEKNLKTFKNISVREDEGKKIIKKLTGRDDVVVLLDPTMLIPIEKWNNIIEKPEKIKNINNKKYILNYFLGNVSKSRQKEIERIAEENNCEIINIMDKNDPFYLYGPSEFLYLEKNAFLICTDSFHSSVFAILFNRPFIVFDREDSNEKMNSRLETLLKKFNLSDRWFDKSIKGEQLIADFKIEKVLKEERDKAKKFLKEAFI